VGTAHLRIADRGGWWAVPTRREFMSIRAYLQLIRLPNVFTAAADSLAGWLLVRGTFDEPERWGSLLGASMAIYAAGVALNDVFDFEIDRAERPGRPLPSGRVSKRSALVLGVGLLALGLGLAALSGSVMSLIVAAGLVACVLAYDGGWKRTWIGPELMGVCRGLNVLLGMSHDARLGGSWGWAVAGAMGLFVAGVTWISRSETQHGVQQGVLAGLLIENLAVLGLLGAAIAGRFPALTTPRPIIPIEGLLVLVITLLIVDLAASRAVREPTPPRVQSAVKTGVFALVWLNVGLVAAVRGIEPALAVAALWVPAFVLGRWLYAT
jgi:4-hydroxybenzoate polyprenyltransferase